MPTKTELQQAYKIVSEDLFNSLLKMKEGESIWLGKLGAFTKKELKIKSALKEKKTFVYYKISFRTFKKLKEALNTQLIDKYARG
ncbi:MAG: hypothetical protein MRERV_4c095 [Mycoplasmataceae bacterium RV_VA103A]|nr:MAG: hypothetical protein MRERV_11c050 [Mycoplasmataceae bacterium RV_VA103A]KLL05185.1 MAG: hypothetical protein MRERV_4c095 [Mycoplasmataceae bacterium RV_VA103A]